MSITLVILHIALFSVITYRYTQVIREEPLGKVFVWAVRYKILAGVALGILYKIYYNGGGDTYVMFHEASQLAQLVLAQPDAYWRVLLLNELTLLSKDAFVLLEQPRAFFMVKLLSVLCFLTGNNYWLTSFYLSGFSAWGMWLIANTLVKDYQSHRLAVSIAFLFFPSFVFWSAGVSKESVLIGCLGLSVHHFLKAYKRKRVRWVSVMIWLVAFYIIWRLKYYYAATLFPVLLSLGLTTFLVERSRLSNKWLQGLLFLGIWSGLLLVATWLHPNLRLNGIVEALYQNHQTMLQASHPKSILLYDFIPTWQSVFYNMPKALFNGLYRPFFWEGYHFFYVWLGIENAFLFLITVGALYFTLRRFSFAEPLLVVATLGYVVLLAIFIGLSSPNFGSLARYKVGYGMFFLYICLASYPNKYLSLWKRFRDNSSTP